MSHARHRILLAIAACPALSACAIPPVDLDQAGLKPEIILSVEADGWAQWIRYKKLDPEVRPLGIRDLRCTRPRRDTPAYYACSYWLDYGKGGALSGSVRRKNWTIMQNPDGSWEYTLIVSG